MRTENLANCAVVSLIFAICGCTCMRDSSETKVKLDETPVAVRQTIQRELEGGQLEDIARETRQGKTVYETDIIRNGHKWEVVVDAQGAVISKQREGAASEQEPAGRKTARAWQDAFNVSKANLRPAGNNLFLTVQPGRVLKLGHEGERLTVTILPDTKVVDGVRTGVLEEREEKDGQLVEISRNYFATDEKTQDVYYFGEDVDNYRDGKLINHDSAWLAGVNGARFGLMMPGKPKKGLEFYQEIAPKVAMDRVEIVSTDETVKTPAGTFHHCVHFRETTPMEPDVSHKYYAPGVGLVKDDDFELLERP